MWANQYKMRVLLRPGEGSVVTIPKKFVPFQEHPSANRVIPRTGDLDSAESDRVRPGWTGGKERLSSITTPLAETKIMNVNAAKDQTP